MVFVPHCSARAQGVALPVAEAVEGHPLPVRVLFFENRPGRVHMDVTLRTNDRPVDATGDEALPPSAPTETGATTHILIHKFINRPIGEQMLRSPVHVSLRLNEHYPTVHGT